MPRPPPALGFDVAHTLRTQCRRPEVILRPSSFQAGRWRVPAGAPAKYAGVFEALAVGALVEQFGHRVNAQDSDDGTPHSLCRCTRIRFAPRGFFLPVDCRFRVDAMPNADVCQMLACTSLGQQKDHSACMPVGCYPRAHEVHGGSAHGEDRALDPEVERGGGGVVGEGALDKMRYSNRDESVRSEEGGTGIRVRPAPNMTGA